MGFLTKERLEKWRSVQPPDILAATESTINTDPAFAALVEERLPTFTSASIVVDFVDEKADDFIKLGRAGRLRFAAWVLRRDFKDIQLFKDQVWQEQDDAGEEGSAGAPGIKRVSPYFVTDLLALTESLGPRIAARIVDGNTLDAVLGAGVQLSKEITMSGGMR